VAVIFVVFLGFILFSQLQYLPTDYWILTDGAETTALVTGKDFFWGKSVAYSYTVAGQEYTGKEVPKWPYPEVGDQCMVYYSVSHPWLSLLIKPKSLLDRCTTGILLLSSLAITAIFMLVAVGVRRFRRRHYPPLPLR
jgi:hypothetical protein